MGGANSEISTATSRVLLEAAYFAPMAIARTTKRLGIRSEASARFERGCDPWGIDRAALRLGEVLAVTAGPRFGADGEVIDVRGPVPDPAHVRVRTARVNAILGTELDDDAVVGYLEPIGFACARDGTGRLGVTVPTFRPDTSREIDVIEEVARHHGYGALPRRRPSAPQVGGLTRHQKERRLARAVVAGFGAHEAWTPSLLAPEDHRRAGITGGGVEVANPLSPDETVLRRSILPGMLKALAFNADASPGGPPAVRGGPCLPTTKRRPRGAGLRPHGGHRHRREGDAGGGVRRSRRRRPHGCRSVAGAGRRARGRPRGSGPGGRRPHRFDRPRWSPSHALGPTGRESSRHGAGQSDRRGR